MTIHDILKLTLAFLSKAVFLYDQKSQNKNLNTLITKRDCKVKIKTYFIFFKGLSVVRNYLRSKSWPLAKNQELPTSIVKKQFLQRAKTISLNKVTGKLCKKSDFH